METNQMNGGSGRVEGEGTTNGGMTTEEMAGMDLSTEENDEDSADVDSNTLGGTESSGSGPV